MALPSTEYYVVMKMTKADLNVPVWNNLSDKVTERLYNASPAKKRKELYRDFCSYTQSARIPKRTQTKFMQLPLE